MISPSHRPALQRDDLSQSQNCPLEIWSLKIPPKKSQKIQTRQDFTDVTQKLKWENVICCWQLHTRQIQTLTAIWGPGVFTVGVQLDRAWPVTHTRWSFQTTVVNHHRQPPPHTHTYTHRHTQEHTYTIVYIHTHTHTHTHNIHTGHTHSLPHTLTHPHT